MTTVSKEQFIRDYSRRVMEGSAALFVGAGVSRAAGYVDWKELLREIAEEVELTVDREHDLIALAQYHLNQYKTRAKLNEKLIEEFTRDAVSTENHQLIAQLPIHTVWTTNYDSLLEDAFRKEHKQVDVKSTAENVAQTRPGTDVTIFKMHGDASHPASAVLTKDDYERYSERRELFTVRLKGDLVTYTFLFLGFSFSDPNIDYILSRIKNLLGQNTPLHYCIMRRPRVSASATPAERAENDYDLRKLSHRVEDLKRFGVQTVLVDNFNEITSILRQIKRRAFFKNILVSGSAAVGNPAFDLTRLATFARLLGSETLRRGYNLVSGYGLGIGSDLLVGALESLYGSPSGLRERLILRPFPRTVEASRKSEIYRAWRDAMVSFAGFTVFLAGNRRDRAGGIALGTGTQEEFELGVRPELRSIPIPVGATGFSAKAIWDEVATNIEHFYGNTDVSSDLDVLGSAANTNDQLLAAIFAIIDKVGKRRFEQ